VTDSTAPPLGAGPGVPAHAAANLRRSSIAGAVIGAVVLALLAPLGHPLAGVFVLVGIGLGALNTWFVQRSVAHFGASVATRRKQRFVGGVLVRLGGITLVALAIAVAVRPDGLGVFGGLAVFQLVMVGAASLPVIRELRGS